MTTTAPINHWKKEELCYCSNVHALTSEDHLTQVIKHFVNNVRKQRRLNKMAAGLWINAQVSKELNRQAHKGNELADLLKQHGINLFTLNGFPYDNFHAGVVKESVYSPDWSEKARYRYTCELANILAECLPEDAREGTISTLPLGFRHNWSTQKHEIALQALCKTAEYLSVILTTTGKSIRLCLEMEPDCVLESTTETLDLFQNQLPKQIKHMGLNDSLIEQHLGICFDVCHQAVMFENIADSMAQLLDAGINIGKIQISSALEVQNPNLKSSRSILAQFAEPKYLHQVRTLHKNKVAGLLDLSIALTDVSFPTSTPWRIHFHVPIQSATLQQQELNTTQHAIIDVLDFLQSHPQCHPHLEVETYTWNVLPESIRPHDPQSLVRGLTEELNWLEREMQQRGLVVVTE